MKPYALTSTLQLLRLAAPEHVVIPCVEQKATWPIGSLAVADPHAWLTLLMIFKALVAKLRVLSVSWRHAVDSLMLAMIAVLALPPMESCKEDRMKVAHIAVPVKLGEISRRFVGPKPKLQTATIG